MAPDYYSLIRSRIEHEDSLITQRLSWFITSQSFFFTAYAIVTVNYSDKIDMHSLPQIIPLVALVTSSLIFITILAGVLAVSALRKSYDARPDPNPDLPPIQTSFLIRTMGLAAPLLLPLLFLVVWLYLLA